MSDNDTDHDDLQHVKDAIDVLAEGYLLIEPRDRERFLGTLVGLIKSRAKTISGEFDG